MEFSPEIVKLSRLRVSRLRSQSTRRYDTRANRKKAMEDFEQENIELRGTITTLQEEVERLNDLVSSLVYAQNQQPPPNIQVQATLISEITTIPIFVVIVSNPLFTIPEG